MDELQSLIEHFLDLYPYESTDSYRRAYDRCHDMSLRLCWFAKGSGYKGACLVHLIEPLRRISSALTKNVKITALNHWVVWIPEFSRIVDLTARQLWPDADYPWILTWEEATNIWKYVEKGAE